MQIAAIRSANADFVVEVARRPLGGETLMGGELHIFPGGKGANQAVAASKAGGSVSFVGAVGDDGNGSLLTNSLESAGVDTSSLLRVATPTGTAIIMLTPDGENSIVVCPGANHEFAAEEAAQHAETWRGAQIAVLSLEIPISTVEYVASDSARHGTRVVLNAAPAHQLNAEVLGVCDPLIVNEHEALEVLGADTDDPDRENFARLAERLLGAGARSVVITLGSQGALVADASGCTPLPAFSVTPVDTTGAGDAFVGALSASLARQESLSEAVTFAQAMAALSVQHLGAQSSYVNEAEVREFLADQHP